MILLATAIERRKECAEALERATGEPVLPAVNLVDALSALRTEACTIAVFDEQLAQTEPAEMEKALEHLGTAVPVQLNLAICGKERLVREVQAAARRRRCEEECVRKEVMQSLHGELSGTLTTLLLDCELALDASGLSPEAVDRLDAVHHAAQMLRVQLGEQNMKA